ncbi:methionine import ATP-binding protein MetN [Paenibacillus sp. J31TS4]|uniref:methionine ABC transporter ATP-binding protein n=1 Tax=Paenibacillus sp. J31TS4 TaxID=2807195 RepID=UPI001B2CC6E0|nr:methionine ABC transporter ATP-binding protein [Paenibacillus sp. J31TS4]GIP40059.1 methionine import ATP-binding protein MetN [Paenibacillus sp. J31TS4]
MIRIEDLSKTYGTGQQSVTALSDISLSVAKGEIFGIIGHSGAGKSTLLRSINLLERPTSGKVTVNGVELTALRGARLQTARRSIGMIFQHFNLLASATVYDNIAFPLKLARRPKEQIAAKVNELLSLVGLEAHRDKFPSALSGGQKQRVGIARALASDPDVLLCDEATSALDPQTTGAILQLLLSINRKLGITIVLITHEMQVIRSICDRVAVIDGGRIVESGPVAELFLKPQHPTTREFVEQVSDPVDLRAAASLARTGSPADDGLRRQIVRVTFLGNQTYEPILFEATRDADVSFIILQGTISRMKDVPYGQLVVELDGEPAAVDRTLAALRERGLEVEVL